MTKKEIAKIKEITESMLRCHSNESLRRLGAMITALSADECLPVDIRQGLAKSFCDLLFAFLNAEEETK